MDGADKRVGISGERMVPDENVRGDLHESFFKGGDVSLLRRASAMGCAKAEEWEGRVVEDGFEEVVAKTSENELLLQAVCWAFEEEERREAVLRVCEH